MMLYLNPNVLAETMQVTLDNIKLQLKHTQTLSLHHMNFKFVLSGKNCLRDTHVQLGFMYLFSPTPLLLL